MNPSPGPMALLLLGIGTTAALARLARSHPTLRPLVLPWALSALGVATMPWIWAAPRAGSLDGLDRLISVVWLMPPLVVVVRACVILAMGVFKRRQRMDPPELLGSVTSMALYLIGIGAIASRWYGVDLTPFLATSAILGAVVGLALQDTLGNLFAGIALHTQGPFRVGDWVRFGEKDGRVEQVSWRAVQLRTWDGDTLTVPNNESARHSILNYSVPRTPHSRVVNIPVDHRTPPNKAIAVIGGVLDQVPGMPSEPPPSIRLVTVANGVQVFEVRYQFTSYEEWRRIESEINRLVWYHFDREGIEIGLPIRDVRVRRAARVQGREETAADRLERALRQIDLFGALSDDELRLARDGFRPLHYSAGERIIAEGSAGGSFFLIDRGQVEVWKSLAGTARPIARLGQGQFFGEMSFVTGEQRTATIVAVDDVDLFTIDKAAFQRIVAGNPRIAEDIAAILAQRREAIEQAKGDVTQRLEPGGGELSARILDRIRRYFGL